MIAQIHGQPGLQWGGGTSLNINSMEKYTSGPSGQSRRTPSLSAVLILQTRALTSVTGSDGLQLFMLPLLFTKVSLWSPSRLETCIRGWL